MTEFQKKIIRELDGFPMGMATARVLVAYVARERLTIANIGAYATNIDRAALKMPQYVTRLPPEDRWDSPMLCLTDEALDFLSSVTVTEDQCHD